MTRKTNYLFSFIVLLLKLIQEGYISMWFSWLWGYISVSVANNTVWCNKPWCTYLAMFRLICALLTFVPSNAQWKMPWWHWRWFNWQLFFPFHSFFVCTFHIMLSVYGIIFVAVSHVPHWTTDKSYSSSFFLLLMFLPIFKKSICDFLFSIFSFLCLWERNLSSFHFWFHSFSKISMTWWWERCTNCKFLKWLHIFLTVSFSSFFPLECHKSFCFQTVKFWHVMAFSPLRREKVSLSDPEMMGCIMLEKNGKTIDFFPGEVSTDRITAIQVLFFLYILIFISSIASWRALISLHLRMYRKLIGVWHLPFLKLMELTILIPKRFRSCGLIFFI